MDETDQFNIRIPKALLYDLEFVSQNLKISKNDWVRYKIAEAVQKEKEIIINKAETRFTEGLASENEFKQLTGVYPSDGLKELSELRKKEKQMYAIRSKAAIQELALKVKDKSKEIYLDNYLKNVIKKVEKKRTKKKL